MLNVMKELRFSDLQKIEKMERNLKSSKIFTNMVIHDMRSPTFSLKVGLEQIIEKIRELDSISEISKF